MYPTFFSIRNLHAEYTSANEIRVDFCNASAKGIWVLKTPQRLRKAECNKSMVTIRQLTSPLADILR